MSELFCERLRRLRKARGLTQEQLAARLGLHHRIGVSDWETAVRRPSVQFIAPLADALGVTTDYLLTGREAPVHAALIAAIRRTTTDPRVLALVEGR